jgi:hypothetical protein
MLHLWDDGADTLVLSSEEMQQLSFIASNPSLQQCIQSAVQWAPDDVGTPSMLNWLMVIACDV